MPNTRVVSAGKQSAMNEVVSPESVGGQKCQLLYDTASQDANSSRSGSSLFGANRVGVLPQVHDGAATLEEHLVHQFLHQVDAATMR